MNKLNASRRVWITSALAASIVGAVWPLASQAQQPPIKIGFSQSLTGPLASAGTAALVAIQMWAEDVNAKGGLLGRKVELVHYDDQSNPGLVPSIYSKLLDVDKVDLIVTSYSTNMEVPTIAFAMQRGLLLMGSIGVAPNHKFNYKRFFEAFPGGPDPLGALSEGYFALAQTLQPKPKTVALAGADTEFGQNSLEGARKNAKKAGIKIVYDKSYPPNTVDFASIIRAIQATHPDLVFFASFPSDSIGLIRATKQVGLTAQMLGGAMVGMQYASVKTQLGPLLNGVVAYDVYVPEPTMKFPGIEAFLKRYQAVAGKEGIDALGFYIPPLIYSEMQVLGQAVSAVGSIDQDKLADYIRSNTFQTIMGDVKFGEKGEWAQSRILYVQYRDVVGNDLEQFKRPGTQVIIYPEKLKSGELKVPYSGS